MTNTTRTRRNVPFASPGRRRFRLRLAGILEVQRLALVAGLVVGAFGCNAATAPAPVETVGTLVAGPSVWHAPTHATTDFGHAEIVDTGDDDLTGTVTTTTRADGGEQDGAAELPDVEAKDQGLKLGTVR